MGAALLPHMAPKSEQRRSVVSNSSRQSSLAGSAMLHLPRAARLIGKNHLALLAMSVACCDDPELVLTFS
jgi:hypothetical protein